jgi:hypothetical protein
VQRQRLLQPSSSSVSAAAKPAPTSQDFLKLAKQAQADSMASLARSAKLVEDTTVIGTETAVKLHSQTEQMKNIYATVNELDSELGRANQVLRSFLRGAMTDKLTLCFILLLILAVIAVIAVKVIQGQQSSPSTAPPPSPSPSSARVFANKLS